MFLKLYPLTIPLVIYCCQAHSIQVINACSRDSHEKLLMFSHPGHEIICYNLNLRENMTLDFDDYISAQLIATRGSITPSLKFSSTLKYLLIYKSQIDDCILELPRGTHLHIVESKLPKIRRNTFASCNQIYTLGFHSNPELEFEENCFQTLTQLKTLIFYNQHVEMENKCLFSGLGNLTTLVMVKNDYIYLDEKTFEGLTSLTTLILDDNPLEYIKINFNSMPNLKTLSLKMDMLKFYMPLFKPHVCLDSIIVLCSNIVGYELAELSALALAFPNLNVLYCEYDDVFIHQSLIDMFKYSGLKFIIRDEPNTIEDDYVFDMSKIPY